MYETFNAAYPSESFDSMNNMSHSLGVIQQQGSSSLLRFDTASVYSLPSPSGTPTPWECIDHKAPLHGNPHLPLIDSYDKAEWIWLNLNHELVFIVWYTKELQLHLLSRKAQKKITVVNHPPGFPTLYINPIRALPDQQDWYLCITQIHESSVIYISEAVRHHLPSILEWKRGGERGFQTTDKERENGGESVGNIKRWEWEQRVTGWEREAVGGGVWGGGLIFIDK